ncbi:unnamed protein product [Rotaria sp. Silwood2]|nr:unnamed protein product [Rotaria sp. Silwood2]
MNINENDDISTLIASFIKNPESVLQELDVQRLTSIASIPIGDSTTINKSQLPESKLSDYPKANFNSNESSSSAMNITEKFERALSNIAPFLRGIFTEFSHILTKTLVDSHGQELLSSGLHALKQTVSIVELVYAIMFTRMAKFSSNHIVKVANEANFILNRMCADDIRQASEFEQLSAQTTVQCKRRRRLIRNPNGSIHNEAPQKSSFNGINNDLITSVIQEENLLKQLKQQKLQNFNQTIISDDDEILQVDKKRP